ncbi:MAG: hypothetical protein FJ086_08120 [Deltaproteobacteria bacterium]|nr:hypothetical protein [Deltaproteobacteria bacterium]
MQRLILACALGLCAARVPPEAHAHGVSHGTGTLRLSGDRALSNPSFPVSLLSRGDDDQDGRLSPEELQRHWNRISTELRERLRLESGLEQGEVMFEDLLLPHSEEGSPGIPPATHVGVMRSTRSSHPVTAPRLVARLFEGPDEGSQFQATFLDERGNVLDRAGPLEVVRLGARSAAGWLAGAPVAWGLLELLLAAGSVLRRMRRWPLLGAATACGALLAFRALAEQAHAGQELPHALAGGLGGAAVLAACAAAAFGAGLALSAAHSGS